MTQSAKLISEKNTQPVYLYQYNYPASGLYPFLRQANLPDEAANALDIYYVFYSQVYFPKKFETNSENGKMVTKFTTLWKNFVETG